MVFFQTFIKKFLVFLKSFFLISFFFFFLLLEGQKRIKWEGLPALQETAGRNTLFINWRWCCFLLCCNNHQRTGSLCKSFNDWWWTRIALWSNSIVKKSLVERCWWRLLFFNSTEKWKIFIHIVKIILFCFSGLRNSSI